MVRVVQGELLDGDAADQILGEREGRGSHGPFRCWSALAGRAAVMAMDAECFKVMIVTGEPLILPWTYAQSSILAASSAPVRGSRAMTAMVSSPAIVPTISGREARSRALARKWAAPGGVRRTAMLPL